jgi:polyphosphate kinase
MDDPRRFINREMSWLAFDQRIIVESTNRKHPLLERLNFLSISASNLDEFLIVHIANIEQQYSLHPDHIIEVNMEIERILNLHRTIWVETKDELASQGIRVVKPEDLDAPHSSWLAAHFHDALFPALSPLAIDTVHSFPFINNGSIALALRLQDATADKEMRVVIPLPPQLPRFIRLPTQEASAAILFVMLEDVVQHYLHVVFPTLTVRESSVFRVLRDSEVPIANLAADDFVTTFESAVKKRHFGAIVRLTVTHNMSDDMRNFLTTHMNVPPEKTVIRDGFLRFSEIRQLIVKDRPDLLYQPYQPRFPERILEMNGDCFAAIAQKDLLVHHPYETFDVVLQFIHQAARDPAVVAIKQTLYRTSSTSPIVKELISAAEAGKAVTVMVELKARFDEEANIRWARDLEKAGAHVIFGFMDMKTHAKMTLVIRRENEVLKSYAHFGTGNYHPETARLYTDLSFFTCDPALCQDAAAVFNYMTGYAKPTELQKLIIAPLQLRTALLQLIEDEILHAEAGRPAQIWVKLNALVDTLIIDKLYEASRAGVRIELIIRGSCCLRPGVPDLSDNIRVKSIVGRFLEHSRMLAFGNGYGLPHEKAKVFLSSADWMVRNFDRRIETLVPVENPTVHSQIMNQIFPACLMDTRQSWELAANGRYQRVDATLNDFCAHDYFMTNPSLSGRGTNLDKKTLPPHLEYKANWKNHASE